MTFDEWMQGQPEGVAACDSWSFGRKVWEAATVKGCLTVQASAAPSCPRCEYHIKEHEAVYALMHMSTTDLQDKCDLLVIERDAQAVLIDDQQADVEKQAELANNLAAQVRQQNTTIAEMQSKASVLDGLSQVAIDGGWTYRGMEAYAKGLEAKVATQSALIEKCEKALERLLSSYRYQKPFGYPKSDSERQGEEALAAIEAHRASIVETKP